MLKHAIDWMQMGTTVVEGLLLLRVVSLKLYRIYIFVTLYCALNLLFDAVSWYVGWDAPEAENIFIYSLYFFALLNPFVAWDVFEESKAQIGKLRRMQTIRMASGLFLTGICALVVGIYVQPTDAQGNSTIGPFMGVFLLTGAASAGAAFLWFLYRFARTQKIAIAHNTFVWTVFFIVSFLLSILDCMEVMIRALIPAAAADIAGVVLLTVNLALLAWCIFSLKAVPSDVASASENA
jgi:hypothetical protein